MRYQVRWRETAVEKLAEVWNQSPHRASVTNAANRIDARLAQDPENDGESRPGGRRILVEAPLAVYYRVDATTRTVRVLTVWEFRKKRGTS